MYTLLTPKKKTTWKQKKKPKNVLISGQVDFSVCNSVSNANFYTLLSDNGRLLGYRTNGPFLCQDMADVTENIYIYWLVFWTVSLIVGRTWSVMFGGAYVSVLKAYCSLWFPFSNQFGQFTKIVQINGWLKQVVNYVCI